MAGCQCPRAAGQIAPEDYYEAHNVGRNRKRWPYVKKKQESCLVNSPEKNTKTWLRNDHKAAARFSKIAACLKSSLARWQVKVKNTLRILQGHPNLGIMHGITGLLSLHFWT